MFVKRSKKKTDCELVNLRINLEEAKNENSTVLQVLTIDIPHTAVLDVGMKIYF